MESNLLLEQYSIYKKLYLEKSPYKCLLGAHIELNPHQVNAFCAAIQALKTGGIILADEVGLGKTIEAGLVLRYMLNTGAKKILIALPANLRKQWEIELEEKFELDVCILDRPTANKYYYDIKNWIEDKNGTRIIITSYDFASKLIKQFAHVKWDFLIIDEAHNLRNVFHGTKRAKKLYDLTKGIPKILLTATPLQNSLSDLHGLVSFIDPRIFGSEQIFNKRFVEGQDYSELKNELRPVLYRTLRKDVGKYMNFKKRECVTVDFQLTPEEKRLYSLVNSFLKRDSLYSIPNKNRGLIVLVIRKLLASSSFALIETFEVLKDRLEKLYKGTKSEDAQVGFELFWAFVEDEMDEKESDDAESVLDQTQKEEIQDELDLVNEIIKTAASVKSNAKIDALKQALEIAFNRQKEEKIAQKAVVFTESKRTQKYIASELRKDGYSEEDILLFNGDSDDAMSEKIYRAWKAKNYGHTNYGRNIEYKHAIVDYFQTHGKVLITTDAGSEGLNLQFCNTVINYDLPWNPQKIEQRIGRCHRYGQTHDVVAINLLNTENEADKRVYEILRRKFELFDGVFGASDVALGTLESGSNFEKRILDIYQKCDSQNDFEREFDKLDYQIDSKLNDQVAQLRSILLTESPESKGAALDETKKNIDQYLQEVSYWNQFSEPEIDGKLYYWQINNWSNDTVPHGILFLGAFCDNSELLFPVLSICDTSGQLLDLDESEIVRMLESVDDSDVHYFKPSQEEIALYGQIYNRLTETMTERYMISTKPIQKYNQQKMNNWVEIQTEQLDDQIREMNLELEQLLEDESLAWDSLEKSDIMKKIGERKKRLDKLQKNRPQEIAKYKKEAEKDIDEFNEQYKIKPAMKVNIVLKF